jgi:hypothetical protein
VVYRDVARGCCPSRPVGFEMLMLAAQDVHQLICQLICVLPVQDSTTALTIPLSTHKEAETRPA